MDKEIIIALAAGLILLEIFEHVIFPLAWSFIQRKKGSSCDVFRMIGKLGEVTDWQELQGKVLINGEIWNAKSDARLFPGDKALIERIEGFVLTVKKMPTVSHGSRKD